MIHAQNDNLSRLLPVRLPDTVLATWVSGDTTEAAVVLPDGCRDLIIRQTAGQISVASSELDTTAYSVASDPTTKMIGLRFRPGVQVDWAKLVTMAANIQDAKNLQDAIESCAHRDTDLTDALDALAEAHSDVSLAAKHNGVSLRQFQRLVSGRSGQTPRFWRQLARARRTARLIDGTDSLADLAIDMGYADQPHLARDMRRWFGLTASQIARIGPEFRSRLGLGYGDTGEHISTR